MIRRSSLSISRRAALTALGAGAALAALLPEVRPLRAASSPAKYFIGVYMPHGMAREFWVPRPGFQIAYEGSSLAPFDDAVSFGRSFRDQIVTLEGLDLTAGLRASTVGHDASRVILTGSGKDGQNASIDQFLAVEQGLGKDTPLSSLVLGVGSAEPALQWCISYAKGGTALPKLINPLATFNHAFGQFLVDPDPAASARAAREQRLGKSLLDYWRADLAELSARSPKAERDKLDQHATALRELEKRVLGQTVTCAVPSRPDPTQFPAVGSYQGGEPYFDLISELQIDLMVQAFACGVTRIGTLFLADLSRTHFDPDLPEDVHTDVAHRYASPGRNGKGSSDAASQARLARQNRYVYGKIARILQRLSASGLLEETVLVAMSDMGDPSKHSSRQVPTLLAGGWGGALRAGRHIDLGAEGTPSNRLLVSVQQAFGVESDSYGQSADPSILSGTLALT
ncbi:MAG TPA: DUF1552 domain-containing protein [Polyangiaceae bacterium]|nr:DUF1552 domain-containing protein [Polyangiaceae bacterium]